MRLDLCHETVLAHYLISTEPELGRGRRAGRAAVFVSSPAEYFGSLALIKQGSPSLHVSVEPRTARLAIPDEAAFGPNGGGYETRLTAGTNSKLLAVSPTRNRPANAMTPDATPDFVSPRREALGLTAMSAGGTDDLTNDHDLQQAPRRQTHP